MLANAYLPNLASIQPRSSSLKLAASRDGFSDSDAQHSVGSHGRGAIGPGRAARPGPVGGMASPLEAVGVLLPSAPARRSRDFLGFFQSSARRVTTLE